jgi:hypothetical protein
VWIHNYRLAGAEGAPLLFRREKLTAITLPKVQPFCKYLSSETSIARVAPSGSGRKEERDFSSINPVGPSRVAVVIG